jgi:hypothetical protein
MQQNPGKHIVPPEKMNGVWNDIANTQIPRAIRDSAARGFALSLM